MGQRERNYLGQPIRVAMPCGVCKGTGKQTSLRADRTWDNGCRRCGGSGVLLPEQNPEQQPPTG